MDGSFRLKEVFDHFDTEGKGYITVQHFATLAANFVPDGGEEEIQEIAKLLDSKGDGKISYEEFCEGVQQIASSAGSRQNSQEHLDSVDYSTSYGSQDHSPTGPSYIQQLDSVFSSSSHDIPHDCHVIAQQAKGILDDGDSAISDRSVSSSEDRTVESPTEEYTLYDDLGSQAVEVSSTRKLPSAAQLAGRRYMYRAGPGPTEEAIEQFDESYSDLLSTVKKLETANAQLTEKQRQSEERHHRLRDENSDLTNRIHALEEQLKDVELKFRGELEEERRTHRESMAKFDRSEEMQILTESYQRLREENEALKEEAPRLKAEIERLRKENIRLEHQIQEVQEQLASVLKEKQELQARLDQEQVHTEQQVDIHNQLLEELSREVDELRSYKQKVESGQSPRTAASESGVGLRQMRAQIQHLKKENAQLKESQESLQAQMLQSHLAAGRSLLANGTDQSLASELEAMPRGEINSSETKFELLTALKEQREENGKLREYLDQLMVKILEQHPSLLEMEASPKQGRKK